MKNLKILAVLCFAAVAFSFHSVATTDDNAGPMNTTINYVSVDGKTFFIPCTGEVVTLSGYVIVVSSFNHVGNRVIGHVLTNPQGVKGISTSGITYQVTGNGHMRVNETLDGQSTIHLIQNLGLLGQGRAANLVGHQVMHLTVNANGDITAEIDFSNISCR